MTLYVLDHMQDDERLSSRYLRPEVEGDMKWLELWTHIAHLPIRSGSRVAVSEYELFKQYDIASNPPPDLACATATKVLGYYADCGHMISMKKKMEIDIKMGRGCDRSLPPPPNQLS